MGDMISRAAAIDYLMTNMGWRDEDGYEVDDADEKRAIITDLVNGIPGVDAVPVVHGRLIKYEPDMHGTEPVGCSACNYLFARLYPQKYCPNCGAKLDADQHLAFADQSGAEMDGERRDDDGADA